MAYKKFTNIIEYMCNRYCDNEALRKTTEEAKAMMFLYCDALTGHNESHKEGNSKRLPPFSQGYNLNTATMMEAIVELQVLI